MVTFRTILSQLIISLLLLFILWGSTLHLLLTLWLDIAFNVFHVWCAREMNINELNWEMNISNNYIIKSYVRIKLKCIRISLDIYQHISYHAESKKEEINISTMKNHQMSNKWQHLTCIKVIFRPKLAKWYSDTQTVICQWKLLNYK